MGVEWVGYVGGKQEELKIDLVLHWEPVHGGQDGSDVGCFPGFSQQPSSNILNEMRVEHE